MDKLLEPPYSLEDLDYGFMGICHERKNGGPSASHTKCSVLKVSTISKHLNNQWITYPSLTIPTFFHLICVYWCIDYFELIQIIPEIIDLSQFSAIGKIVVEYEWIRFKANKRMSPYFWSRSMLNDCIKIWSNCCTLAYTSLFDIFKPFDYCPNESFVDAIFANDRSKICRNIIHLKAHLALALNNYKIRDVPKLTNFNCGFKDIIQSPTVFIGNKADLAMTWAKTYLICDLDTNNLINRLKQYYPGPSVKCIIVCCEFSAIEMYSTIFHYLFQFKHFALIHIASLDEPSFYSMNYRRFDRRQLDIANGVTALHDYIRRIVGIKITTRQTVRSRKRAQTATSISSNNKGNNVSKGSKKIFLGRNGAILMVSILFSMMNFGATCPTPMVCPSEAEPVYIRLNPPKCEVDLQFDSPQLIPKQLTIFKPNVKSVEVQAYYCTIIQQRLELVTDFWGTRLPPNSSQTYLPVSYEECRLMVIRNKCTFGELTGTNERKNTHNRLNVEYKWFDNPSDVKGNCFVTSTNILVKPGELGQIYSPLGDTAMCSFLDKTCPIEHGRIIWDPKPVIESHKTCEFVKFETWRGTYSDDPQLIWTAVSSEFSLSFSPQPTVVEDCRRRLALAESDFAISLEQFDDMKLASKTKRKRRHVAVTSVESPQLAAQLTALNVAMFRHIKGMFLKSAGSSCAAQREQFEQMLSENPTLLIRRLQNNTFLEGQWVGRNILKIKKCFPIFNWRPRITSSCYQQLPINATHNQQETECFLNTRICIIYREAEKGLCEKYRYQAVDTGKGIQIFDQLTGKTRGLSAGTIKNFTVNGPTWAGLDGLHPITFHNLPIGNYTDLQIEMFKNLRFFKIGKEHEAEIVQPIISSHGVPTPSFVPNWRSYFEFEFLRKIAVTTVVALVVIRFLYDYFLPRIIQRGLDHVTEREIRKQTLRKFRSREQPVSDRISSAEQVANREQVSSAEQVAEQVAKQRAKVSSHRRIGRRKLLSRAPVSRMGTAK